MTDAAQLAESFLESGCKTKVSYCDYSFHLLLSSRVGWICRKMHWYCHSWHVRGTVDVDGFTT